MNLLSPAERHGNAVWTGANREKLEKLWSAGYSARLIAAEFETTRNAILGAVHRLKLPKRQVAVSAERAVYVRLKGRPRATRSLKFKPIVCEPIEVPIPDTALRVSLIDRKDHQCCYPIEGMIYCGADKQAGSSYCPWHHRMVWVKPIKTRKAPEPRVKSFSEYEGAI
mgnify:FL=1